MTTTEGTPATTSPEDTGISPPRHPLDPLTGAEIEAATSILKRDRHLADSARFVYVTLREPAKETVLNHQPGQEPDREAHIVLRERSRTQNLRGHGLDHRRRGAPLGRTTQRPAPGHARGVPGHRRGGPERSPLAAGDAPARRHRLRHGDDRPVVGRVQRSRGRRGPGPVPPAPDLGPARGSRRQRVRPPGGRPDRPVRPGPDGGRGHRGPRGGPAAAGQRQLHRRGHQGPRQRPALPRRPAPRPQASSASPSPTAPASPSTATRCAGRSGDSGSASPRARGWCCTCSGTRTVARSGRSSTAPRWRRCSSPTATRTPRTTARTSSTWANTASGCWPTAWSLAATAWARSATSTPG